MDVLGVTPGAQATLQVLYRLAGDITDDRGRVELPERVVPLLVDDTGVPVSTLYRRLSELARHGLLDREVGHGARGIGRPKGRYFLYPLPRVVERFSRVPSIRDQLVTRWKDAAALSMLRVWAQDPRRAALLAAQEDAGTQTAAATARRVVAKAKRPAAPKKPKRVDATAMAHRFRYHIKSGLSSVYQPTLMKKDLALLSTLLAEVGETQLDHVFAWLCTPENWDAVRTKFRINAQVPTVPVLFGFRASIIPLALGATDGPRRSGGATSTVPQPQEGDVQETENGAF